MPKRHLAGLAAVWWAAAAWAQAPVETVLEEVRVERDREADIRIDPVRSVTTIGPAEIERRQADNIFDIVQDVPGVSVNGGPRPGGMKFNIRGFSDTEDVLLKLDGAVKGFEKYRFGGGVFLEPELLRTLSVERGPSILSGSGAIGGTVSATTRSAADFLRPGEQAGARLKYGYAWNNEERLRSVIGFARPHERADFLAAYSDRNSIDYKLADGSRLPDSRVDSRSVLLKGSFLPLDEATVDLSYIGFDDSGRQPFDATGGAPGVFGTVLRTISDDTFSTRFDLDPEPSWLRLRGTVARARTRLDDLLRPGETIFANAFTGNINDRYDYDILTAEVFNDAEFALGDTGNVLTLGLQAISNDRNVSRVTQNAFLNNALYPGGFNPAQPPGKKESAALIAEHALTWGQFTLIPGARYDYYRVKATGGTQELLDRAGENSVISFDRLSPSAAVVWRPLGPSLAASYSYAETFRPPLIDEYFTQGPFSRCNLFFLGPLAPASGVCGELYQPEAAIYREWSLGYGGPPPPGVPGRLDAKVTRFHIDVSNTIESLQRVGTRVSQPGTEERRGWEFELAYAAPRAFASLAYSTIKGTVFDGQRTQDLYDAPGDTLVVTVGARFFGGRLEAGYRIRDVGARRVVTGFTPPNNPVIGTQEGYTVQDVFAVIRPWDRVTLLFGIDNLTNEEYFLNDGFGGAIGTEAPGRNVKASIAVQF